MMRKKLLWIQINWTLGDPPVDFGRCASFVANLFTYKLPPVSCKGTSKVNVDFTTYPNMEGIGRFYSILTITELFPAELFAEANLAGKIELLAVETHKTLIQVYQYLNLDVAQLNTGYQKIKDDNYQLVRTLFGGPKLNKSRKVAAAIIAEHLLDSTGVKINFLDKNSKVISEIPLFKTSSPGWFGYNRLLHTAKWVDNDTFEVSNRTKEINIRISINGVITMNYQPIDRDIDGIKEEIRFYTLERYFEL